MFETVFKTMFKTVFNIVFKTVFKTLFTTVFKIILKTVFENNKLYLITTSFLKDTDPKKGYFIVHEFLKTRKNIQHNFLTERVVDVNTQYELSELFKPVTELQTCKKI